MISKANIVTVIQARLGSSRFPGKVLLPLGTSTVLGEMIARVRKSSWVEDLIVAIPEGPRDEALAQHCKDLSVDYIRGSELDLLDRHYQVMKKTGAQAIVKIPSDCPLIDPKVIDQVLEKFCQSSCAYDYVSNLHPQTYPDGNDVEVISGTSLEFAWKNAVRPWEREHTTPYIWDQPESFLCGNVESETQKDYSRAYRWTLDYSEDWDLIRAVFAALYPVNPFFSYLDIVGFLNDHPEIRKLNANRLGDSWYAKNKDVLRTVDNLHKEPELYAF